MKSPIIDSIHQLPTDGAKPKQSPLKENWSISFPDVTPLYSMNKSKV